MLISAFHSFVAETTRLEYGYSFCTKQLTTVRFEELE